MATIHGKPLMSLRVVDLKDELEKRGLSKSGAKGALVQRLEEYILENEIEDRDDAPVGADSAVPPSVQIDTNLEDNPMIREYMAMRENQFKTAMVEKVEAKSQSPASHAAEQQQQPPSLSQQQKVIESDEEDAPLIKSKKESPNKRRGRGASEAATERMQTALALEALDDDDEEEVIQKYPRKKRARGSSETEGVKSPPPTMKSPTMKSPTTMKSPSHVQNEEQQPIAKDETIEKSPLKKSRGRGSSETNLSPAYEPTSFKNDAPSSPSLASPPKKVVIEQPAKPLKIESPKKTPPAPEVCPPVQEPKVPAAAAAKQKTPISEKVSSTEQTPKERVPEVSEKSATKEVLMESPKKQVLAAKEVVIAKKVQMQVESKTLTPPAPKPTTTTKTDQIKEIEQPRPLKKESPKKLPPAPRRPSSPEEDKEPEDAVDEIVVSEPILFDEKEKDDDEEEDDDQEEVSSVSAEKREPVTSFRKLSRLGSSNQNNENNPRKKRTWGDSKKTKSGFLDTTAVSSSELKDIVPDIAPVLEELKEEERADKKMDFSVKSDDHVVTKTADDESVSPVNTETNEIPAHSHCAASEKNSVKMATTAALLPKPIVEDPEDIKGKLAPVSEKNKNQSCVVEIRNLVRPFTNSQLVSLLKRTGAFDENEHFWIDKIKSHAMVKYEQPQEAEETVLALDGVKWPSSNQKKLIVTFTSEDHFERQSKEPVSLKQRQRLTSLESGGRGSGDRDGLDGRPQVKRSRAGSESTERSGHEEKRARKDSHRDRPYAGSAADKDEEKSPKKEQKSLEVLFNKTKALPSIYWLPKS